MLTARGSRYGDFCCPFANVY
eukprot:COSAG01_NODE_14558_length_1438_cov_1.650485_2_plen_20_part_01